MCFVDGKQRYYTAALCCSNEDDASNVCFEGEEFSPPQPLLSVTETQKKIDLHLILPMSSTFKKDSSRKNGIAIATRNFFRRL